MVNKKRILIYAHYYYPDVASTGQIIGELAEGILDQFDVTVICTVPSYNGVIDETYRKQTFYYEEINGVKVIRVKVPPFNKVDKNSRVRNIMAYTWNSIRATLKCGPQDYIFSISQPPVLGGLLGVWGKCVKHAKFIYNIQDFNPEQIMAVDYSKNRLILSAMMCLDKFSCRNSDLVVTVGRDLVENMHKRFRYKDVPKTVLINNWIDEEKIYPLTPDNDKVRAFREKYGLTDKFVFMYSGNIGLYYDLENIIKVIKKIPDGTKTPMGKDVYFAFVGEGAVKKSIEQYASANHMSNVVFIPYQDQKDLVYSLNAADVHWCVNANGIKGVSCPSKYYGLAAVGKPVIGVLEEGTEIRCLIEESGNGVCCAPGDYRAIEDSIWQFIQIDGTDKLTKMGARGRSFTEKKLKKSEAIQAYKDAILNI